MRGYERSQVIDTSGTSEDGVAYPPWGNDLSDQWARFGRPVEWGYSL